MDINAFYDRQNTAPDAPAGEAFTPWRLRLLSPGEFEAMTDGGAPSGRQLAYLAAFNLLAPTSHNTVPQRFVIEPSRSQLSIVLDRSFVLPASDVHGRQAAVSLGCGIANTVAAGRCYGLRPRVELSPVTEERTGPMVAGQPRYTPIADIVFDAGAAPSLSREWLTAMVSRRVVRAEYDLQVALAQEFRERLDAWMREWHPETQLHWIVDAPAKLFLAKLQELSDATVVNRDAFATELGDWLLENDATASIGMRGREFGLDDDASRRIRAGLRRDAPLLPDELAGFAKSGNIGIRTSSAVAVLTVAEDTVGARVRAGWAYEELALQLYQHGFTTAMHAGVTELEAPNMALRGRLRTTRRPTVVFRVGRPLNEAAGRRPHSARPALASVILDHALLDE